jgi:hypothetical protein
MDRAMADADAPNLGVGAAGKQTAGRGQRIFPHLKRPGVYVKGHDLPLVAGLHLGAHLLFVECCAAAGVLLLAIPWLGSRHGFSPVLCLGNFHKRILLQPAG